MSEQTEKRYSQCFTNGSGVHIKPTKKQTGGFLGTLLASIGVPLALEAFKKMVGGSGGVPRIGKAPLQKVDRLPEWEYINHPLHFMEHGKTMVEEKKKVGGRVTPWGKTVHSMGFHCWEQFFEIPQKCAIEQSRFDKMVRNISEFQLIKVVCCQEIKLFHTITKWLFSFTILSRHT